MKKVNNACKKKNLKKYFNNLKFSLLDYDNYIICDKYYKFNLSIPVYNFIVKKHVLISTVLVSLVIVILEYLKGSCGDYLQDAYVSDFQIYFQQSYFKFDINNLLCHGSVLDVDIENEVVTVLFNTKFYLIASQIFLLILFIVQIKFVMLDTKKVIFLYIFLVF